MASARKNLFGLGTKRVTYHRDVAGERAALKREEKGKGGEAIERQKDYAYSVGQRHGREGRKPIATVSNLATSEATKVLGQRKATDVARAAYKKGFRETSTRRNPVDAAASLSEAWHGRPAKHADEYTEKIHYHGVLTDLGRLRDVEIRVGKKSVRPIAFDKRTRLASSENGKQLYVVGGDQSLDLSEFGISGEEAEKDLVIVGPVAAVTYDAAKQHLEEEDKICGPYRHVLGEEGGAEPLLVYDTLNALVGFAGGSYHIDRDLDFGAHSAGLRD